MGVEIADNQRGGGGQCFELSHEFPQQFILWCRAMRCGDLFAGHVMQRCCTSLDTAWGHQSCDKKNEDTFIRPAWSVAFHRRTEHRLVSGELTFVTKKEIIKRKGSACNLGVLKSKVFDVFTLLRTGTTSYCYDWSVLVDSSIHFTQWPYLRAGHVKKNARQDFTSNVLRECWTPVSGDVLSKKIFQAPNNIWNAYV